jgi:hypothetical protein
MGSIDIPEAGALNYLGRVTVSRCLDRRIHRSRRLVALALAVALPLACAEDRPTEPSLLECEIHWQLTITSASDDGPIANARIWAPEITGGVASERTLAHTGADGRAQVILELVVPSNIPTPVQPFVSVNVSVDGYHTTTLEETVGRCETTSLIGVYRLQPCGPGELCI